MKKYKDLEEVKKEIEKCKICQKNKIGKAVSGEGNPNADIVFIGEAPGKTEAKSGRPFVGRSGQLLRRLIREIGLSEEDVYITSPVKYLPLYGTPKKADIRHGMTHLEKQLNIIAPKLVVLLGSVAAQGVLEEKIPTLKKHGTIIEKGDRKIFITLHPAAAIRFQRFKEILFDDFEKLKYLVKSIKKR